MSPKWVPLWVQENRSPTFVDNSPATFESHFGNMKLGENLGIGLAL
jgi:hypothetical protein